MVLEKTPESPLDSKEIKAVNHMGSQAWLLIRRTDAEAESPVLWSSDENSLMLGKSESRRRKGCQKMWWLDSITNAMDMNSGKLQELVKHRHAWRAAVHGIAESDMIGQLNNSSKPMMTQVHISWLWVFMCFYDLNMQTETKELFISNIICALQYVF